MNFQQQLAVVEGLGIPPDTQMRMDFRSVKIKIHLQ